MVNLKSIQLYSLFFLKFLFLIIQILPLLFKSWLEALNILELKRKSTKNKTILITGGGNGLGCELAMQFAAYEINCTIVIADIDLVAAQKVVANLKSNFNVSSYAYHVDVSEYDSVIKLYENVLRDIGYVDILVNNAGLITFISLREKEWSDIERILKVNLFSHFITTRIFITDMIKRKSGHIVGISSMAAYYPSSYMITYSATKHGVNGFMKSLSNEMYCDGHSDYIKTTLVCPYFIKTRPEISEYLDLPIPPFNASNVAKTIVDGILKEKDEIFVPQAVNLLKLLALIPLKCYNKITHHYNKSVRTEKFELSY